MSLSPSFKFIFTFLILTSILCSNFANATEARGPGYNSDPEFREWAPHNPYLRINLSHLISTVSDDHFYDDGYEGTFEVLIRPNHQALSYSETIFTRDIEPPMSYPGLWREYFVKTQDILNAINKAPRREGHRIVIKFTANERDLIVLLDTPLRELTKKSVFEKPIGYAYESDGTTYKSVYHGLFSVVPTSYNAPMKRKKPSNFYSPEAPLNFKEQALLVAKPRKLEIRKILTEHPELDACLVFTLSARVSFPVRDEVAGFRFKSRSSAEFASHTVPLVEFKCNWSVMPETNYSEIDLESCQFDRKKIIDRLIELELPQDFEFVVNTRIDLRPSTSEDEDDYVTYAGSVPRVLTQNQFLVQIGKMWIPSEQGELTTELFRTGASDKIYYGLEVDHTSVSRAKITWNWFTGI